MTAIDLDNDSETNPVFERRHTRLQVKELRTEWCLKNANATLVYQFIYELHLFTVLVFSNILSHFILRNKDGSRNELILPNTNRPLYSILLSFDTNRSNTRDDLLFGIGLLVKNPCISIDLEFRPTSLSR